MELGTSDPNQFVRDLADLLKKNSSFYQNSVDSFFDNSNLLKNKKKFTLFLSNEGKLLKNVGKSKGNIHFQNEVFPKMLELVLSCANCNFVHGDLTPTNIFYAVIEEFQTNFEDDDDPRNNQKNTPNQPSSNFFRKIKPTRRIRHKLNSSIKGHPNQPMRDFFENSFDESFHEAPGNKQITSEMLLASRHRDFLIGDIKEKVQLKLTGLGLGKILDSKEYTNKQKQALEKYLNMAKKSRIKLEFNPVDKYFDFFRELRTELKVSVPDKKLLQSQIMTRSFLRDNNFLFNRNARIESKKANRQGRKQLKISKEAIQSEKFENEFEIIDPKEGSNYSISDNLHKFFFSESFFKKKSKLGKDKIKEINALADKIKKKPIKGNQKYASIFSFLKVESYFLGDFESMFYSILEVMNHLPKKVSEPVRRTSSFMFNSQVQSSRPSYQENVENISSFRAKITFITNLQIDVLLSILANICEADFPEYESGINFLFGFHKKTLNAHRKIQSLNQLPMDETPRAKGYGEVDRFYRLRKLLLRINEQRQAEIFEFFNLRFEKSQNLLIKLSLENSEEFCNLPTKMRVFYQLFKKWFFHFLVFLMLSKQCHFIHKFCILLMLKSSV